MRVNTCLEDHQKERKQHDTKAACYTCGGRQSRETTNRHCPPPKVADRQMPQGQHDQGQGQKQIPMQIAFKGHPDESQKSRCGMSGFEIRDS